MDLLARSFPDQVNEIGRLRSSDTVFAQICSDYESLMALLPRDANDPTYSDIIDSLHGLEGEIRHCLEAASTMPRGSL